MGNPTLDAIAAMIPEAEKRLQDLKDLIRVSTRAGEDRTAEQAEMVTLEQKLESWRNALKEEGYKL